MQTDVYQGGPEFLLRFGPFATFSAVSFCVCPITNHNTSPVVNRQYVSLTFPKQMRRYAM